MAAMTPDQGLRTNLISTVHKRLFVYLQQDLQGFALLEADTALGAMYAPLALKVPVKLTAYPTTTGTPSKSHTSVVTRGTIRGVLSGVAAFLVIVAVALVVWRRRRQSHRRTSLVSSSVEEVMSQGTQVTITPFNLPGSTFTEVAPLDTGPQTDLPEQLVRRSPLLRAGVSVPVGLSSKELARLRSLANESRSQPVDGQPSNSPLITTADRDAGGGAAGAATSPSETRILSEVNVLRDEIQRLHAEISEPPPSYASGAA
ncbi:hypothetical protein EDB84DRAFT_530283 [Lactarius hengduanensis]|nr:hypothetical protein EDB84DRAFT_530283 [Lactarius hengduanensis]